MDLLKELLKQGATLVDVRKPEEFAAGHAPVAVNIPLDTLDEELLKWNKEHTFIIVCHTGTRSRIACKVLLNAGFTAVYDGGIWENFK